MAIPMRIPLLAGCARGQLNRIACKAAGQDVAHMDRRALLLALVAAPGLAQLQPAYAGKGKA